MTEKEAVPLYDSVTVAAPARRRWVFFEPGPDGGARMVVIEPPRVYTVALPADNSPEGA